MATIMGISVSVDGIAEAFQAESDTLLHELYESIGCQMVEAVYLPDFTIWVDEEGLLQDSPQVNVGATQFASHRLRHPMPLVGNCVITGGIDDEGHTLGLSTTTMQLLLYAFERRYHFQVRD
jgi:hypothetical protein